MKIPIFTFALTLLIATTSCARPAPSGPTEFTVVAYNLENVFDVDGVAIFNDYRQDEPDDPFTYSRRKFLTKLENVAAVLSALDSGGPDVILIQELEGDFTPDSSVTDIKAFLTSYADKTVRAMLTDGWQKNYMGFPSVAWLAKAMDDIGMDGYHVIIAPTKPLDSGIAHVNAIFSRFPAEQVHYHEIEQARDIIEAELDVNGHSLWVYNNHWKSGASNPDREPIRVQNATVLRALVDARLEADPQADILIGGDLNSHYNHSILYPDIQTGINDVLGSQGRELWGGAPEAINLYNLWYEIPAKTRYSEVWRGRRGTLMHLILSRGLYDASGISYVDKSFEVGQFRELNADAMGRPLEWNFAGQKGGGASDHFPLIARFSTRAFDSKSKPSPGLDALDYEMRHDDDPTVIPADLPDGRFLNKDFQVDEGEIVDRLYSVNAKVIKERPLRLNMDGKEWSAYAPAPHVYERLKKGTEKQLVVSYGYWKGKPQLVVEAIR